MADPHAPHAPPDFPFMDMAPRGAAPSVMDCLEAIADAPFCGVRWSVALRLDSAEAAVTIRHLARRGLVDDRREPVALTAAGLDHARANLSRFPALAHALGLALDE